MAMNIFFEKAGRRLLFFMALTSLLLLAAGRAAWADPPVLLTSPEEYAFVTKWGSEGAGDGEFAGPHRVAVDDSENVYVADMGNKRIQKFDSTGAFITKWGSEGTGDGEFYLPSDVAVDGSGNVYVPDMDSNRIQKFDSSGNFLIKWGSEGPYDGQFSFPSSVAVDDSGNVYVTDSGHNQIQKFDSSGNFLTKWGWGIQGGSSDGELNDPCGLAVDSSGNVYVADFGNHRIQKFTSSGDYLSKWGSLGSEDGEFRFPYDVAVDDSDNVYVADMANHRIQKFDSTGAFITKWGSQGAEDGEFGGDYSSPYGVAVGPSGKIYAADHYNDRIQVFVRVPGQDAGDSLAVTMSEGGSPTAFDLTLYAENPEGDSPLTWSISSGASHGTADVTAPATGYSMVITYAPDAGFVGADSFEVEVQAPSGAADTIVIEVTVLQSHRVVFITDGTVGASLSGFTNQHVNDGDECTSVTALPPANYQFQQWTITGRDPVYTNPITLAGVDADTTCTAVFQINTFSLTYLAGPGGTVDGQTSVSQSVIYGGDGLPVTAIPDTGYSFIQWSDGSTTNPRTDTAVTTDMTATADFAIRTFSLTFTAGANGSLSGDLDQAVEYGSDSTAITALADAGYVFLKWMDGSVEYSRDNPLIIGNVTQGMELQAVFCLDKALMTTTQTLCVEADGPWTLGHWKYVNEAWSGDVEDYTGPTSYTFALDYLRWHCIGIQDSATGAWKQFFYVMRDAWNFDEADIGLSMAPAENAGKAGELARNKGEEKPGMASYSSLAAVNTAFDANHILGIWNYHLGDWIAYEELTGPSKVEFPFESNGWFLITVYNAEFGVWSEAIYCYLQDF
ncbi:MAG: InlB B-repeat-containing protein [Candidatus Sumerlaeia bacterium]